MIYYGLINLNIFILITYCNCYKYKLSVIIPVYKAESWLRECMDSIINQTLKEMQVICVNDESPDNSLDILLEYAKKDKRITVLSIKHSGISESRNQGLKLVEGEFIGFVDDDDFIDKYHFEKMYEFAKKDDIDLLAIKEKKFYDGTPRERFINHSIIYTDSKKYDIDHHFIHLQNENWNKLYKTKIIKDNGIFFEPGIGGEDINFNFKYYPFVKTYKWINSESYYFRKKKKLYGKDYYFKYNRIFFQSIADFYKKIKFNKNDPLRCFEMMVSSYRRLIPNLVKFRLNHEYIKNFFVSLEQLNVYNQTILNKSDKHIKKLFNYINNEYVNNILKSKKINNKKKEL